MAHSHLLKASVGPTLDTGRPPELTRAPSKVVSTRQAPKSALSNGSLAPESGALGRATTRPASILGALDEDSFMGKEDPMSSIQYRQVGAHVPKSCR